MDEIISYKMCAVKVRNAKLRNYLNVRFSVPTTLTSYVATDLGRGGLALKTGGQSFLSLKVAPYSYSPV